jgi:hypothetical protein
MSQFRNKTEAQQAIQDMEKRAGAADRRRTWFGRDSECERQNAANYSAEAGRIRALIHTLPD